MPQGRWLAIAIVVLALVALGGWLFNRSPGALDDEGKLISLVAMFGWLALLGGGLAARLWTRPGTTLRHLGIWVAIFGALILVYSYRDLVGGFGDRFERELMPGRVAETSPGEISTERAADGHFYLDVEIDGVALRLLVDTGASEVALSPADAERLGFDVATLDYNRQIETANGTSWAAPVRLERIAIGPLVVEDVRAQVLSADVSGSLLGMSLLSRFSGYAVEGDTLRLWQ